MPTLFIAAWLLGGVAAATPSRVAIVTELHGTSWASSGPAARRPLASLDWIEENETIEVGPGSSVTLVFVSGARYELRSRARARATSAGLTSQTGQVRTLTTLPALPVIPSIRDTEATTGGAVRIRGPVWPFFPSGAATTVASHTVLRFAALPGASVYEVVVVDNHEDVVFQASGPGTTVSVAGARLAPGTRYTWRVRALRDGDEIDARSDSFVTLDAQQSALRERFLEHVERTKEAALWAVVGLLDAELGLRYEARAELHKAVDGGIDASLVAAPLTRLDKEFASIPD